MPAVRAFLLFRTVRLFCSFGFSLGGCRRLFGVSAHLDEAAWRDDARAFMQSCEELGVPAALEISRSGKGAHAWVFFASRVAARDARRLGTAIISHTCSRTRQLKLELLPAP